MNTKQPESYLHDTIVIVPIRVAATLARRFDLHHLALESRGFDNEVASVLIALRAGGQRWITTATGNKPAPKAEAATPLQVGTHKAAELLHLTPRRVRQVIQQGRLPAERINDRWLITREAIEQYKAARRAA